MKHSIRDPQEPDFRDKDASAWSSTPFEYEVEVAQQLEKLLKKFEITEESKVLEIACGVGHGSAYLASKGFKTTLLDFNEAVIERAKEYYKRRHLDGDFIVLDMFNISEESVGLHDVVWISRVLDRFDGWQIAQALERMGNVAEKLVVVISQNPDYLPYLQFRKMAHEKGWWKWGLSILRKSMKDLAELAGLEVIEERFFSAEGLSQNWMSYINAVISGSFMESSKVRHDNKKPLRVLIARPRKKQILPKENMRIYDRVLRTELEAMRNTYNLDTSALKENLPDLLQEFLSPVLRRLVAMQQFEEAMSLVRSVELLMSYPSKDAEWNYNSAFCMHNLRIRLQEAIHRYDLALQYGFDEFWVRYNRGVLHSKLENIDQARTDLMCAIELKPDHDGAREVLRSLPSQNKDE